MVISPDGQWIWNGDEWVPSLPTNPPPPLPPLKQNYAFQPSIIPSEQSLPTSKPPNTSILATAGRPPKTDAFDTKIRLNYPKEMPDSRKTVFSIQIFCFLMVWFSSVVNLFERENFSQGDLLTLCSLLVVLTLISSGVSYFFGIGVVDIIFLRWKYTLGITSISYLALLSSPIIAFYLASRLRLQSDINSILGEMYFLLEDISPGVGEIVLLMIGFFGSIIPYAIFLIIFNKSLGRVYQKDWAKMTRIKSSKSIEKRKSSIANAIGLGIFGMYCIITGIVLSIDPDGVRAQHTEDPSILGNIVLTLGVNFIALVLLFVGVLSIVLAWYAREMIPDEI